jgi:hypothetical protein
MLGQAVAAGSQADDSGLQRPGEQDVELRPCTLLLYARIACSANSGPAPCSLPLGVPLQDIECIYL